jgi:hypothetical protein
VWQVLVDELEGFTVVSVALDSDADAAARCIRRYPTTYPVLIDQGHAVGELYGMVNVPSAIWIDEEGQVARPTHIAGAGEYWRHETDRSSATREITEHGADGMRRVRAAYMDAVRAWVLEGRYERREPLSAHGDSAAHAHFRLATYLYKNGLEGSHAHFAEAVRLRPDSWNFRRQALALEQPGDLWDQFWGAVDATAPGQYYPLDDDL